MIEVEKVVGCGRIDVGGGSLDGHVNNQTIGVTRKTVHSLYLRDMANGTTRNVAIEAVSFVRESKPTISAVSVFHWSYDENLNHAIYPCNDTGLYAARS